MHSRCRACPIVGLLLVSGCHQPIQAPDLGGLYSRLAQEQDDTRNPVIVIPGILGSRLIDPETDQVVWGAFGGGAINPESPDGARLAAVPMHEGSALRDLTDSVQPAGVLDRAKLNFIGLPIQLKAYVNILASLGVGGYRDQLLGESGAIDYGDRHYTCFQFDYDWRLDNVQNARRLHEFLLQRREYVAAQRRERFGDTRPVKFDIVAHSMGGLLTRYFLRYGSADLPADGSKPQLTWAGAELVERAILIGTPNAGSVKALDQLVNGADFAPLLPRYQPAVIGTMPAVYQLLPRARHGVVVQQSTPAAPVTDLYDVRLWERMKWGLADPKQDRFLKLLLPEARDAAERRRIALDHLAKCLQRAEQFAAALDVPASPPAGLELYLFAGDAVPTLARLSVNSANGKLSRAGWSPGDGTVTRDSALLDERLGGKWTPMLPSPITWKNVTFLFTDHLGLTADPAFTDNVLHLLLEQRRAP